MHTETFIKQFRNTYPEDSRKLITEFFIIFSRFECALKATIKYTNQKNNKVGANWDTFIADIKGSFNRNKNESLEKATDYLLKNPPKIQCIQAGHILWENRTIQANTPEINNLCQHIRDIRNNLFHGGKFNGVFRKDVSRNYILLKSAIIILDEWLNLNADVKNNFLKELL